MIWRLLLILLTCQPAYSHTVNKPVDTIPSTGQSSPENHGGYGLMGVSSEAEAQDKLNFVCPSEVLMNIYKIGCNTNFIGVNEDVFDEKLYKAMEAKTFEEEFKNKLFEYAYLSIAAQDSRRPIPMTKPNCIANNPQLRPDLPTMDSSEYLEQQRLKELDKKVKYEKDPLKKKILENEFLTLNKMHALRSNSSPLKMGQALILYDQYVYAEKDNNCSSTTTGWQIQLCSSVKEFKNKVLSSFPFLNSSNEDLERMREQIYEMIGSHNNDNSVTRETQKDRGQRLYRESITNKYGVGWDENSADNLFTNAHNQIVVQEEIYNPASGVLDKIVPKPKNYDQLAKSIQEKSRQNLYSDIKKMCSNFDLKSVAKKYPQVLKQMLLDFPNSQFDMAKNYVCQNKMNTLVDSPAANSCSGVTGDIDSPNGMVVERYEYTFPFGSQKRKVIKKVGDSLEVSTKVHFKFLYDPSLSETEAQQKEQFDRKTAEWISKTNAFYSKMKDKMKPSVIFKYEASFEDGKPLVNVSKCYRRTLPEADRHRCDKVNEAGGNWEDAGNYTLDTDDKTLSHEMGHQLGLDDEYSADYYPINHLGESDSVMKSGTNLYPRHIRRIVQPALRCSSAPRPELTPVSK